MPIQGPIRIDSSFKFKDGKERYETEKLWAQLSIKQDPARKDYYVDVLIGTKGKDPHIHVGINADQTIRFQEFRDKVHSVTRKVESKQQGLLEERTLVVKPGPAESSFTFGLTIDAPTKTILVKFEEAKLGSLKA